MAALGAITAISGATVRQVAPLAEVKELLIEIPASAGADDTDTFTVDLAAHGATRLTGIQGYDHTTDGSVVVAAAPTTSVTSSVLTVTIGGATDNLTRSFVLWIR